MLGEQLEIQSCSDGFALSLATVRYIDSANILGCLIFTNVKLKYRNFK